MPGLGDRFRAAREARGLSLSEAAEQIRIRSLYLEAIEDENWREIGAPVYIVGFLRTYAKFLDLDKDEVVREYRSDVGEAAPPGCRRRIAAFANLVSRTGAATPGAGARRPSSSGACRSSRSPWWLSSYITKSRSAPSPAPPVAVAVASPTAAPAAASPHPTPAASPAPVAADASTAPGRPLMAERDG